jgi:CBS domain-containing protein
MAAGGTRCGKKVREHVGGTCGGFTKAKDIMIPLHGYLREDSSLREAARRLVSTRRSEKRVGVKGLPVLDGEGRLVGIVSMGDVLKAVFPEYLALMDLGEFTWEGMAENLARKVGDKTVSRIMTREVIKVREESSLMECVNRMIKHNVKRLPVLDGEGRVVGVVYERDVFAVLTKAMLEVEGQGP